MTLKFDSTNSFLSVSPVQDTTLGAGEGLAEGVRKILIAVWTSSFCKGVDVYPTCSNRRDRKPRDPKMKSTIASGDLRNKGYNSN